MTNNAKGRNGKNVIVAIAIGVAFGFTAGAIALLLLPFAMLKIQDPSLLMSISAIFVGALSGYIAGKTTKTICPDASTILCAVGVTCVMVALLMLLSLIIDSDGASEPWVLYSSLAFMLICSVFGAKSPKRKIVKRRGR